MKLLSRCKLLLYPEETKTGNYKKIVRLFKYCFSYKLKYHSKTPGFPRNPLGFFPTDFLINIVFHGMGCNQIYIIILLTTKLETKKVKLNSRKKGSICVMENYFPM